MGRKIKLEDGTEVTISVESYDELAKTVKEEPFKRFLKYADGAGLVIYGKHFTLLAQEDGCMISTKSFVPTRSVNYEIVSGEQLKVGDVVCPADLPGDHVCSYDVVTSKNREDNRIYVLYLSYDGVVEHPNDTSYTYDTIFKRFYQDGNM